MDPKNTPQPAAPSEDNNQLNTPQAETSQSTPPQNPNTPASSQPAGPKQASQSPESTPSQPAPASPAGSVITPSGQPTPGVSATGPLSQPTTANSEQSAQPATSETSAQSPPQQPAPTTQQPATPASQQPQPSSADVPAADTTQPQPPPVSAEAGASTPNQQTPTPPPTPNTADQAMQTPKPSKSKKKLLLFIAIPVLLIITAVGVYLGSQVLGSNLTLTTYEGDNFSISYPETYEQKSQSGLIVFEEPLEKPDASGTELEELKKTQSGVIVAIQEIPTSLKDEQKNLLRQQYEKAGDNFVNQITGDNQEIKNKETIEDIQLAGIPAKRTTGELFEDGEKIAEINITFALDDQTMVVVAVLSHVGDSALAAEAQTIIDSFELAE